MTVENQLAKSKTEAEAVDKEIHGVLNDMPVAVYTCDARGYITSFNRAAADLWGREPKIGKDLWCGSWKIFDISGEPMPLDSCPMALALKSGTAIIGTEIIVERPDGSRSHVRPHPVPQFDSSGKVVGAVNTLIDFTEQVLAAERQERLAAIVDTSDDAIISKTAKGVITSWNRAAEKMFGYKEEEVIGKHISLLIPETRLMEEDAIMADILNGKKVNQFETVRRTKAGAEIPVSLSVSPIKDQNGNIIGASKIARDISDQKLADEKERFLAAIVETSDDAIISKTLQGIITSWNRAAEATFGYTEQEVLGKHISLLIPPDRLAEEDLIIGNISAGKKIAHFETIRRHKSGKDVHISLTISPIKDKSGKIIGASKIARDIGALKMALEQTQRYARNLEITNSLGREISQNLETEAILQKVTDACTKLTGAQFGAFFYNTFNENGEGYQLYTLSGADKAAFEKLGMPRNTAIFKHTFTGSGAVRIDNVTKDERFGKNPPHYGLPEGHLPVTSYLAVPVMTSSAEVIGGLFFGHVKAGIFKQEHEDLVLGIASQASIALENARLYSQVMTLNAKKDEFIGMASHELKTPLTSITGYLQILERMGTGPAKAYIAKTVRQVQRMSSLVSELLDISKIEAGKLQLVMEDFDLKKLIDEAIDLIINSQTTHKIILHCNYDTLPVHADSQRIEQLLVNLLTNAVKYSPAADTVEVLVSREGGYIKIGVKDRGLGIPIEKQKNLFKRFYRVEGVNPRISGLGIGLYICREVVERHNGTIFVESVPGKGSTFWVNLPCL